MAVSGSGGPNEADFRVRPGADRYSRPDPADWAAAPDGGRDGDKNRRGDRYGDGHRDGPVREMVYWWDTQVRFWVVGLNGTVTRGEYTPGLGVREVPSF